MDRKLLSKIRNGTRSGKRLCDTCNYGRVMRGEAESEEVVYCSLIERSLPMKVVECNDYQNKSVPSIHEMRSIAWMVRTDHSGRQIGFVSPEKWRALVRAKEVIDDDD